MSTFDLCGPGQRELDMQTPDLTGKIAKLDDHYSKAGGFSDVYKSYYFSAEGTKAVAVKAFRFNFSVADDGKASRTTKMIRRELGIWRRLRHPNIVPFLGIVYDFERRGSTSLVSEWMSNGTLESFFSRYDDQLTLAHRLQLLLDIANGLSYLHSFPMVHGDLTCNNVLLDKNFNARLTDFGLTSAVGDIPDALRYLQMSTTRPGAIRWAAPEYFSVDTNAVPEHTIKSDVYSFGNLALLTLSGKHPWSEFPQDIAVVLRLHQGDKPSRPKSRPVEDMHWELIERCWLPANERPRAGDVVSSLENFLKSCSAIQPLRDVLRVVSDSSDTVPKATHMSVRELDPLDSSQSPVIERFQSMDIGQSAVGNVLDARGEQDWKRRVRDDSPSKATSPALLTKQPQSAFTDLISEEFMRYISTEVPHRLIDTSTMKFVERTALFDVFSEEIARISEEDIKRQMGAGIEDGTEIPYHIALREIIQGVVKYATLSHCWTDDEPSFRDVHAGNRRESSGFKKLAHFCEAAKAQGYTFAWADTCCINESNRTEHIAAIQSTSNWCAHSHLCIVHLAKSTSYPDFHSEPWFARNWPLLELLVSKRIKFHNMHWQPLTTLANDKDDESLMSAISAVTLIPTKVLIDDNRGGVKGRGVWEIMSWASSRKTTRYEDAAYSLCGLFGVTIPVVYGEGAQAFYKLVKAIVESGKCGWDVFAWVGVPSRYHPALPSSPKCYPKFDEDMVGRHVGMANFSITTNGLYLTSVPLIPLEFDSSEAIAAESFQVTLRPRPAPELGRFGNVTVVCGVLGPRHLRDAEDLHACILNYQPVGLDNGGGELGAGKEYVCFLLHSRNWYPEGPTWVKYTTDNQLRISYSEIPVGSEAVASRVVLPVATVHIEALPG